MAKSDAYSEDKGYLGNPLLKKINTPHNFTEEQQEELIKCMNDQVYFAEKYIKIVTIDDGLVPIKLYDYQKKIIRLVGENNNTAINASRQSGKTTTATAIILHYILFEEHKRVAILANKKDAAVEVLDRIKTAYEELPKWMQHGIVVWNKGNIELENGCKVIAAASTSSAIRGKTCVAGDTLITLANDAIVIRQRIDRGIDIPRPECVIRYRNKLSGKVYTTIARSFTEEFVCDAHIFDGEVDNWEVLTASAIDEQKPTVFHRIWTREGFKRFSGIINNGKKKIVKISLSNGKTLKATPDHQFYTDGHWVEAGDLSEGFTFFRENRRPIWVTSIEVADDEEVFDPVDVEEVSSYDTYGIESHNCSFVYIDEAAFLANWLDFFASTYPVLSSGKDTKLVLTSTPNGQNHFYDIVEGAKAKTNDYAYLEVPWFEVPGRDAAWAEKTLRSLNNDESRFDQEFCCSFLGKSGGLIGTPTMKILETKIRSPIFENGSMKQYLLPEKENSYVMTVDVSRGRGLDYSTFNIFDISQIPFKQSFVYRDNTISPIDFAGIIRTIGKLYNNASVLIELNDLGQQVADIMTFEFGYENILFTESSQGGKRKQISGGFGLNALPGITTTKTTKSIGCNAVKLLLEQGKIELYDKQTLEEFRNFVMQGGSYAAASGCHDDLVMNFVLFGWIADQTYFTDMTGINLKEALGSKSEEDLMNELTPFGISTGADYWEDKVKHNQYQISNDWNSF